jgi:peptidoglycan/xylan/chitin deacetylase (PgdA/CDA1 family)
MARGLRETKLLAAWQALARRDRPVVLTYHRVLSDEAFSQSWSHPSIMVTRDTFESHMALLRRSFRVLALDDFIDRLDAGRGFEPSSCLVTFDDGWRDTYVEAWPILKRHDIPAVVFLSTGFIGTTRMFWQEELGAMLHETWRRSRDDRAFEARAEAALGPLGFGAILHAADTDARDQALALVRVVKQRGDDPAGVLAAVESLNGSRPAQQVDAFMSWQHVAEMHAGGVTFGAHGVSHRLLPRLSDSEAREEICQSRAAIEGKLSSSIRSFAYPNGDWSSSVADTVRDAGFAVAFGTTEGPVNRAQRYWLRRINIHESATADSARFEAKLAGLM